MSEFGGMEATSRCRYCLGVINLWPVYKQLGERLVLSERLWVHEGGYDRCPGPGTKAEPLPDGTEIPEDFQLLVGVDPLRFEVVLQHPRLPQTPSGMGYINFSPEQARGLADKLLSHAASLDPVGAEVWKHRQYDQPTEPVQPQGSGHGDPAGREEPAADSQL